MPPLTLLIPGSLNGEPGLFAALPGVLGSRSWPDWPGGRAGLSAQAGPAAWTRHQESLVVAGPAFPFCACFASVGWANYRARPGSRQRSRSREGRPTSVNTRPRGVGGASLLFRGSSKLLGRFLVVTADSVGWDVADGRTTHIWAVLNPRETSVWTASWRRTRPHTLRRGVSYETAGLMGASKLTQWFWRAAPTDPGTNGTIARSDLAGGDR
jgi:hypothetical protein